MKKYRIIGRITALLLALIMMSVLSSCQKSSGSIELASSLTEEERVYYTGQEFDTMVSTSSGTFSKIPEVYVIMDDGSRSEDLSHSDKVKFTGYDPERAGEQVIKVTYRDGSLKIKTTYKITVRERELVYMEADDTFHYLNPFKVGDKFVISEIRDDGAKRGVTITFRYNDPENPTEAFFADDPKLEGISFDTTGCALDAEGKFTQSGTFYVQVRYGDLTATYKVRVAEAE